MGIFPCNTPHFFSAQHAQSRGPKFCLVLCRLHVQSFQISFSGGTMVDFFVPTILCIGKSPGYVSIRGALPYLPKIQQKETAEKVKKALLISTFPPYLVWRIYCIGSSNPQCNTAMEQEMRLPAIGRRTGRFKKESVEIL